MPVFSVELEDLTESGIFFCNLDTIRNVADVHTGVTRRFKRDTLIFGDFNVPDNWLIDEMEQDFDHFEVYVLTGTVTLTDGTALQNRNFGYFFRVMNEAMS